MAPIVRSLSSLINKPNTLLSVKSPEVPFGCHIMHGMKPGHKIKVTGKPGFGFDAFSIELCNGSTGEVALLVNPRNQEKAIVRNSRGLNGWDREERATYSFPFTYGRKFTIKIRVATNRFLIFIDGKFFAEFYHRVQPLKDVDLIQILGHIEVSSVTITGTD